MGKNRELEEQIFNNRAEFIKELIAVLKKDPDSFRFDDEQFEKYLWEVIDRKQDSTSLGLTCALERYLDK